MLFNFSPCGPYANQYLILSVAKTCNFTIFDAQMRYYIHIWLNDSALNETIDYSISIITVKSKKKIRGKLTKALKAGRWAAISYIQQPEQQKYILAIAEQLSDIHRIRHIPSDQISDLNP